MKTFDSTVVSVWVFLFTLFIVITIIEFIKYIYNCYQYRQFRKRMNEYKQRVALQDTIYKENNSWNVFCETSNHSIETMKEVIEDALSYGFEFKVEDHKIWWRDI